MRFGNWLNNSSAEHPEITEETGGEEDGGWRGKKRVHACERVRREDECSADEKVARGDVCVCACVCVCVCVCVFVCVCLCV